MLATAAADTRVSDPADFVHPQTVIVEREHQVTLSAVAPPRGGALTPISIKRRGANYKEQKNTALRKRVRTETKVK
jgi:hypothetical protein